MTQHVIKNQKNSSDNNKNSSHRIDLNEQKQCQNNNKNNKNNNFGVCDNNNIHKNSNKINCNNANNLQTLTNNNNDKNDKSQPMIEKKTEHYSLLTSEFLKQSPQMSTTIACSKLITSISPPLIGNQSNDSIDSIECNSVSLNESEELALIMDEITTMSINNSNNSNNSNDNHNNQNNVNVNEKDNDIFESDNDTSNSNLHPTKRMGCVQDLAVLLNVNMNSISSNLKIINDNCNNQNINDNSNNNNNNNNDFENKNNNENINDNNSNDNDSDSNDDILSVYSEIEMINEIQNDSIESFDTSPQISCNAKNDNNSNNCNQVNRNPATYCEMSLPSMPPLFNQTLYSNIPKVKSLSELLRGVEKNNQETHNLNVYNNYRRWYANKGAMSQ